VVASACAFEPVAVAGLLWPWLLVGYLAWFAASWPIASFFGDFMLRITPAVTITTPFVLVLILVSALSHDAHRQATTPARPGLVPHLVPLEVGNRRELAEQGKNDQAWSVGFSGPFFLVDGLLVSGLIIAGRRFESSPPHS